MSEKDRRLKWEGENPGKKKFPFPIGQVAPKFTPEQIRGNYERNFRKLEGWKPGRVTAPYRQNYDQIHWH